MISRMYKKAVEFVFGKGIAGETARYIVVGGMTTLVNYGLFELMWEVIGIAVTISNVTAISASVVFAYAANKLVVFRSRSDGAKGLIIEFLKFVGSRLFTMALEIGAVLVFFNILGYNARIVKIAAQVVVIILNYAISKVIVFRGKTKDA